MKKFSNEDARRLFVINKAISYKWSNDEEKTKEIISSEDWSACGDKFQIAIAVLWDDFEKAAGLMEKIGPGGEVKILFYRDWPLFKKFRETKEFSKAYEKVFGVPYIEFDSKESIETNHLQ